MENKGGKRLARKDTDRRREELPEAVEKPAETEGDAVGPQMSRGRRLWHDYGYLLVTLAVVFVLFRVLLQLAYVPSGSMETTIPHQVSARRLAAALCGVRSAAGAGGHRHVLE